MPHTPLAERAAGDRALVLFPTQLCTNDAADSSYSPSGRRTPRHFDPGPGAQPAGRTALAVELSDGTGAWRARRRRPPSGDAAVSDHGGILLLSPDAMQRADFMLVPVCGAAPTSFRPSAACGLRRHADGGQTSREAAGSHKPAAGAAAAKGTCAGRRNRRPAP